MLIAASDPDEPCFWFCIDAPQHPCVIVCAFDVVAIDPEIESIAVRLHVSIAFAVFDNGTDCKTIEGRGERTEDNGWMNGHRVFAFLVIVCM